MNLKVHVLTTGFSSQNASAFLYPLIKFQNNLLASDIQVRLFYDEKPELYCCDVLIVESTVFSKAWSDKTLEIINKLKSYKRRVAKVFYFDITDSSGIPHMRALPHVDGYFKSYLLKDRAHYLKPLYGFRLYTDYYHYHAKIEDQDGLRFEPVQDPGNLKKLGVSWCSGFANYGFLGKYQLACYRHLPLRSILNLPQKLHSPKRLRKKEISCRIGLNYSRKTVAYQRKLMQSRLEKKASFSKISRAQYFNELRNSKLVLSPFGFGEVCYRDYETFLSGAALVKPDMSHMETWPNFFRANETMLTHAWDLSDLEETLDAALLNSSETLNLAEAAQACYWKYTASPDAGPLFTQHFSKLS